MVEIATTFLNLVPVTLAQGLMYGFVALGIMVPFRLLNFPDLTCEGSFPLGGCVCAALLVAGVPPVLSVAIAVFAGVLAGFATAFLHLKFRINTLLAGILMITMLWSVNLRFMGKSNIPLFTTESLFEQIRADFAQNVVAQIILFATLAALVMALLNAFLRTESGLAIRATGANPAMARAQGINTWTLTLIGVGVANGFNAFAGAAVAQVQGYADVGMGFGILINALAALIIGEAVAGRTSVTRQVIAPFVGSIIYYQVISVGLAAGVQPSDLKLVTGIFVVTMLALPARRRAGAPSHEPAINA